MTNLLLPLPGMTDADDWIGLGLSQYPEPSWLAGLQFTENESGDSTVMVYLSTPFTESTTLDLQISRTQLAAQRETFDSDDFYSQFSWSVAQDIDLAVSYRFQGQQEELEIDQLALQIAYNPYPAFMSLEYMQGELFIHTRDRLPDDLNIPNTFQSDLSAIRFSAGWWFEDFSLSAMIQRFEYEAKLSALRSRPLLQLLVKPAVLAQTGLLLSRQSSISLDIPLSERDLALHLLSSRSEVNNSETTSIQLNWSESLSNSTSLILSINRSDEQQDNWSFGAGLEWNG